MELICDGCGAPLFASSNKIVGENGGPTKSDIEEMDHWTEGSYICGGRIPDKKQAILCSEEIVLQQPCWGPIIKSLVWEESKE